MCVVIKYIHGCKLKKYCLCREKMIDFNPAWNDFFYLCLILLTIFCMWLPLQLMAQGFGLTVEF